MGSDTSAVRDSYDRIAAAYACHYAGELLHKPLDRELLNRFAAEVGDVATYVIWAAARAQCAWGNGQADR